MTSRLSEHVERSLSVLLTLAAVVIAGVLVRREFAPRPSSAAVATTGPVFEPQWKDALAAGTRVGPATAPVSIVEFTDLECPACRHFQPLLDEAVRTFPGQVAVTYVHYPLPQHRLAVSAARAAECAAREGRFVEWMNAVYARQDSLGLRSWESFARDAGLPDTAAIARCAKSPEQVDRIERGLVVAEELGIRSTPTVFINGWRYDRPPGRERLSEAIRRVIQGRSPIDSATGDAP